MSLHIELDIFILDHFNHEIMKTILVIGGYGNAGREIVKLLLEHTADLEMVIAGRNGKRAQQCADSFQSTFPGKLIQAATLDIQDADRLRQLVSAADFVVNASGSVPHTERFLQALLDTRKDALDTQLATAEKHETLQRYAQKLQAAGICYITDAGFHPGVPGALVRYAARQMERMEKANVFSAMKVDWKNIHLSKETWEEFLGEFSNYRTDCYRAGKWQQAGSMEYFPYDFGQPFGQQYCIPMHLPEMISLPKALPDLRETGFFVGGFNPLTDYVILPMVMAILRYLPKGYWKYAARLFRWGINQTKPPYGIMLATDCVGYERNIKKEGSIKLFHEDAYVMTAAPVVACVEQYLEMENKRSGVWLQADFVDPLSFINRLKSLGIRVEENLNTINSSAQQPAMPQPAGR